jgi:excisionase family DNA binding protein
MNTLEHRHPPPTAQDSAMARASGELLSRLATHGAPLTLRVTEAGRELPIELPVGAVAMLTEILQAMAAGRGITLIPENAELTTVQAAEILNVSRPFLTKLLEGGKIPHRKVGTHRRVRMEDVMDYKNRIDRERESVLDQLVAEAQEEGMGYGR